MRLIDATLKCTFETLKAISEGKLKVPMAILRGKIQLDGSRQVFSNYGRHVRKAFQACKPIVTGRVSTTATTTNAPTASPAAAAPQAPRAPASAKPAGVISLDKTGFRMEQYLAKSWVCQRTPQRAFAYKHTNTNTKHRHQTNEKKFHCFLGLGAWGLGCSESKQVVQ